MKAVSFFDGVWNCKKYLRDFWCTVWYDLEKNRNGGENMKCPYCGKEMEKGEIRNKGFNYFLPEGEKPVSFLVDAEKAIEKRNGILLTLYPYGYGGEEYPAAYCCRECKKIILEYE